MKPLYFMFVLSFGVVAAAAQERTPQAVLRFDQADRKSVV